MPTPVGEADEVVTALRGAHGDGADDRVTGGAELLVSPTDTETRDRAAPRELVDEREVLGQTDRVVERSEHDAGAQLDAFGHRRARGEHRQQRGQVAVGREVVFGHPRGIETHLFDQADELERLAVLLVERARAAGRDLPGEQPYAQLESDLMPPCASRSRDGDGPPKGPVNATGTESRYFLGTL